MKKTFFYFIALLFTLSFASCKKKTVDKSRERLERVMEFRSELTKEDTTTMLRLCDEAMENLKQKKYDVVLSSLYEYNDSTKEVKPLTEKTDKRYRRMFQMFPVLDYTRQYFSFQLEGCNDVKYMVVFATAEQAGTEKPAKTAYMWNPVKVDGAWKLCVKTMQEEIDPMIK